MSPVKVRRSFADVATPPTADLTKPVLRLSLRVAGAIAWLLYAATYALSFALADMPVSMAIRAGIANALPDGLLAIAVVRLTLSRDRASLHLFTAVLLIVTAAAMKVGLLWFDMTIVQGVTFRLSKGIVAWHVFLSGLICVAVGAACTATV